MRNLIKYPWSHPLSRFQLCLCFNLGVWKPTEDLAYKYSVINGSLLRLMFSGFFFFVRQTHGQIMNSMEWWLTTKPVSTQVSWLFSLLCFQTTPLTIPPLSAPRLSRDSCSGKPCVWRANTSFTSGKTVYESFQLSLLIAPLLLLFYHFLQHFFVLLYPQCLFLPLFLHQEKKGLYKEPSWNHFQTKDYIRREKHTMHPLP